MFQPLRRMWSIAMDLSVITVNWKVKDLVFRSLQSLYQHTRGISFEVFFVDNDSRDGSVGLIQREFPQIHIIANQKNLGFAKACNQGIQASIGDFVLLLNPDTEFFDNALGKLVVWMRNHPDVGIAGGKLLNPDRTLQQSVRRFPTFISQALILLKLHHVFPDLKPLRHYFAKDFNYDPPPFVGGGKGEGIEVDQVMGSFFCIRRELIKQIGPLDERYFIWFEEVDYCKMARDADWKVVYTPELSIIHHGGESFAQVFALKKQRMFNDSLQKYMRKHYGFWPWLGITLLSPPSIFLAWFCGFTRKKKSSRAKSRDLASK